VITHLIRYDRLNIDARTDSTAVATEDFVAVEVRGVINAVESGAGSPGGWRRSGVLSLVVDMRPGWFPALVCGIIAPARYFAGPGWSRA